MRLSSMPWRHSLLATRPEQILTVPHSDKLRLEFFCEAVASAATRTPVLGTNRIPKLLPTTTATPRLPRLLPRQQQQLVLLPPFS